MKCYKVLQNCVWAGCTTPFPDWEININIHGKVLAAGTQFSNSLHIVQLSVLSIMFLPAGLVQSY